MCRFQSVHSPSGCVAKINIPVTMSLCIPTVYSRDHNQVAVTVTVTVTATVTVTFTVMVTATVTVTAVMVTLYFF